MPGLRLQDLYQAMVRVKETTLKRADFWARSVYPSLQSRGQQLRKTGEK